MHCGRTAAARREGIGHCRRPVAFLELSCFSWGDSLVAIPCLRALASSIRRAPSASGDS